MPPIALSVTRMAATTAIFCPVVIVVFRSDCRTALAAALQPVGVSATARKNARGETWVHQIWHVATRQKAGQTIYQQLGLRHRDPLGTEMLPYMANELLCSHQTSAL